MAGFDCLKLYESETTEAALGGAGDRGFSRCKSRWPNAIPAAGPPLPAQHVLLKQGKERLHGGVVIAHFDAAH